MPSTVYFFVVVYPASEVYFGCIGCVTSSGDNLMRTGLAGVCTVAAFYLLYKLRDYPDELGLKKEVKTSFLFSSFLIIFLQVWKLVGEDTITPFLNSNNLIMIAAFYINYVYIIRPTLMTFPSIQRRILAKRRLRRSSSKRWCCGFCRGSKVVANGAEDHQETTILSLDMTHVLNHAECLALFKAHLANEFNQENALFWEHATKWVNNFDATSLEENVKEAQDIYVKFICDHACMQVNLDANQFAALRNVFRPKGWKPKGSRSKVVDEQTAIGKCLKKTVFDEAINEIFLLMKRDMFPRFKATGRYQQAMKARQSTSKAGSTSSRKEVRALGKRLKTLIAHTSDVVAGSYARRSTLFSSVKSSRVISQVSTGSSVVENAPTKNSQHSRRSFLPSIGLKTSVVKEQQG